MADRQTEQRHPDAAGLDLLPADKMLKILLDQQIAALEAVRPVLPALAEAAHLMAAAVAGGGHLFYAGAGSSALMANADALELPATFGIDPGRIHLCMAGGLPHDSRMPGASEDDEDEGAQAAGSVGRGDLVIAVTASGSTPYAMSFARAARAAGAKVIAMANNLGAPIFALADVAVALATPPEVIAGSTRMGAGSAQKVALNLLSSLAFTELGAVHDGFMVSVLAENAKLRERAATMVAAIAQVDKTAARVALEATGGRVKEAVLVAGGMSVEAAEARLTQVSGHLRRALSV